MPRCIYCLEEKPEDAFNREHVVQAAFGKFIDNLVLNLAVCEACNTIVGRDLDLKLARDSAEGFARFQSGLKPPHEFKSLGRASTATMTLVHDGPYGGAKAHLTRPGPTEFTGELSPQIGFSRSADGPFEWYEPEALPSADDLVRAGYKPGGLVIKVFGIEADEATSKLEACGIRRTSEPIRGEAPPSQVRARLVSTASHPEFRAIAKIAFNYLAATAGTSVALLPIFNDVRRYVRADVRQVHRIVEFESPVEIPDASGVARRGHLVSVHYTAEGIVGQVSLFCRLRYSVALSRVPFAVNVGLRASAHFFDTDTMTADTIEPPHVPQEFFARRRVEEPWKFPP